MQKIAKRPAFEGLFYAFFKPGDKSENCAPAHAGVRFSRLRGTLKASIFDAFSESARRCPPEGTSQRIFRNFCRFGELFRACFGGLFRNVALPTATREFHIQTRLPKWCPMAPKVVSGSKGAQRPSKLSQNAAQGLRNAGPKLFQRGAFL